MAISAGDVIPLSQARANLSDQVKAGAEKIITKNDGSYVALSDAERLDYCHQLERERIHLLLVDDAARGLTDVVAGAGKDARSALTAIQRRRAAKPTVQLTAHFEHHLEEREAFLVEAEAPHVSDALLDELVGSVIPNLERFAGIGRPFLERPVRSVEVANGRGAPDAGTRCTRPEG